MAAHRSKRLHGAISSTETGETRLPAPAPGKRAMLPGAERSLGGAGGIPGQPPKNGLEYERSNHTIPLTSHVAAWFAVQSLVQKIANRMFVNNWVKILLARVLLQLIAGEHARALQKSGCGPCDMKLLCRAAVSG